MHNYFLFVAVFFLSVNSFAAVDSVLDSTGIEKKGGKTYIVHKVEPKETLYSLSRRYGVSVDDIKKANDGSANLQVGQTLLVPTKYVSTAVVHPASVKTHTVELKETLYSISRKYDVSVDDLKKSNPSVDINDMKVGQVLILPSKASATAAPASLPATHTIEAKETLYSISRKYNLTVDELKKANPGVDINDMQVGQVINLSKNNRASQANNKPVEKKETDNKEKKHAEKKSKTVQPVVTVQENNLPEIKKDGYTKVNEKGFVEAYETNSDFHYALHKSAPIGTIIFLENEDEQKVYVRVMGRLADAAPGVFMKISRTAFVKISKGESKIKVSSSYIP